MANTAHLFRRQSSRDLVPSSYHRTIDNLELKVRTFGLEMLILLNKLKISYELSIN